MKIEDIMTPNPERIRAQDPITKAINKLFEVDVRHLPVVNENDELVGMLSDRDLRSYVYDGDLGFQAPDEVSPQDLTTVGEIMQGDVLSANTEDEISEVITLMIDEKIGAVPIVDPIEGGLVGIISYIDILRLVETQI